MVVEVAVAADMVSCPQLCSILQRPAKDCFRGVSVSKVCVMRIHMRTIQLPLRDQDISHTMFKQAALWIHRLLPRVHQRR